MLDSIMQFLTQFVNVILASFGAVTLLMMSGLFMNPIWSCLLGSFIGFLSFWGVKAL